MESSAISQRAVIGKCRASAGTVREPDQFWGTGLSGPSPHDQRNGWWTGQLEAPAVIGDQTEITLQTPGVLDLIHLAPESGLGLLTGLFAKLKPTGLLRSPRIQATADQGTESHQLWGGMAAIQGQVTLQLLHIHPIEPQPTAVKQQHRQGWMPTADIGKFEPALPQELPLAGREGQPGPTMARRGRARAHPTVHGRLAWGGATPLCPDQWRGDTGRVWAERSRARHPGSAGLLFPPMPAQLPPPAPSAAAPLELPRWPNVLGGNGRRAGLTLVAALVGAEAVGSAVHTTPSLLLGVGAMAGGWWLFRRRQRPVAQRSGNLDQWRERCHGLLEQFASLEQDDGAPQRQSTRECQLRELVALAAPRPLQIGLVGTQLPATGCATPLLEALRVPCGLSLLWGEPLSAAPDRWQWPAALLECDGLVFHLSLPLTAADLRWLDALPEGLPLWLLVQGKELAEPQRAASELVSQWPTADPERLVFWNGEPSTLADDLGALGDWLRNQAEALQRDTPRRGLESLHGHWQAELEQLRRRHWRELLTRTQWLVAAGVVAAPLPSLDLLVLTIANGLMLREMAALWRVPWSAEQLRLAALELGRAALAFGVVEWSTQALGSAMRLHGATWLVGSALSALSAAYLTRVIGRAMADVMALNAGVSSPDLERIRRDAPLLIARAAEAETMDWSAFLQQGRQWLERQPKLNPAS